ncbi:unnamed protein product [Auanema sp. JU1783]|nr:unnamed protein product [Auanema sp. JU1783]
MASSPARATRTSPRKKAWASPVKAATTLVSSLFKEEDLPPLDKSWAEITAEDNQLTQSILDNISKSESRRKTAVPKKSTTKAKFSRRLESEDVVGFKLDRRSERIRGREENNKESSKYNTNASRKRQLSTSSQLTQDGENCSPAKRTPLKNASSSCDRPARKNMRSDLNERKSAAVRLFDKSGASPSTNSEGSIKDGWEDPTLGWCTDLIVLERRTKEIDRAKEKPVYNRYLNEVPKSKRVKGVHPKTPNKQINFSRRSWDAQIRMWKKSLYTWAGEEPSDSVNTSFCSYSSDEIERAVDENLENEPVLSAIESILVKPETDAMASLLGKFDMDTRKGDESTLKAPTTGSGPVGPVDFSALQS